MIFSWFIAFCISLTATIGSLYFSEIVGFVPCSLCWYQRILMYPLVWICLVNIFIQQKWSFLYVLPFSVVGMFISLYHYTLQYNLWGENFSCGDIACSIRYIEWGGFITIPFLSLTAFTLLNVIMFSLAFFTKKKRKVFSL